MYPLQTDLRENVGSIQMTAIRQVLQTKTVTRIFWFPSAYKVVYSMPTPLHVQKHYVHMM